MNTIFIATVHELRFHGSELQYSYYYHYVMAHRLSQRKASEWVDVVEAAAGTNAAKVRERLKQLAREYLLRAFDSTAIKLEDFELVAREITLKDGMGWLESGTTCKLGRLAEHKATTKAKRSL